MMSCGHASTSKTNPLRIIPNTQNENQVNDQGSQSNSLDSNLTGKTSYNLGLDSNQNPLTVVSEKYSAPTEEKKTSIQGKKNPHPDQYYQGRVILESTRDTIPFRLYILRDSTVALYLWNTSSGPLGLYHDISHQSLWLQNHPPQGDFRRIPVHKFGIPLGKLNFSPHDLFPLWLTFFEEIISQDSLNFYPSIEKDSTYLPTLPCRMFRSPESRFPYNRLKLCPMDHFFQWTLQGQRQLEGTWFQDSKTIHWKSLSKQKMDFYLALQLKGNLSEVASYPLPWESLQFIDR